jgi:hypothetical protein
MFRSSVVCVVIFGIFHPMKSKFFCQFKCCNGFEVYASGCEWIDLYSLFFYNVPTLVITQFLNLTLSTLSKDGTCKRQFYFYLCFNITEMSDKIKVAINVRRLIDREKSAGRISRWRVINNSISRTGKYSESYSFGKLLIILRVKRRHLFFNIIDFLFYLMNIVLAVKFHPAYVVSLLHFSVVTILTHLII